MVAWSDSRLFCRSRPLLGFLIYDHDHQEQAVKAKKKKEVVISFAPRTLELLFSILK